MTRSILRIVPAVSAAVLLLGACGGGSSKATPAASGQPAADNSKQQTSSTDACTFVNKDDATALFGVAATQGKDEAAQYGNDASSCIWQADDSDNHGFLLQIRIYNDEAHYGGAVMDKTEPVSGLGDKAFVRKDDGPRGVDVQFVQGGKTYAINYGITNVLAQTKKNASEQADQVVALVKEHLTHLAASFRGDGSRDQRQSRHVHGFRQLQFLGTRRLRP